MSTRKFPGSGGQGALEYLLLIGGAVLIAAVAITLLSSGASSGKNVAINAQNTYGTDISGLQTIAGLTIYAHDTISNIPPFGNPSGGCFQYFNEVPIHSLTNTSELYTGLEFANFKFLNPSCDGTGCLIFCNSSSLVPLPYSQTLDFTVPTKINTAYKVTFKVADYNSNCGLYYPSGVPPAEYDISKNVLDLTFSANTSPVTQSNWRGDMTGKIPGGSWAYPSFTFTATSANTTISIRNNLESDFSIDRDHCYRDLNLILNWLKVQNA